MVKIWTNLTWLKVTAMTHYSNILFSCVVKKSCRKCFPKECSPPTHRGCSWTKTHTHCSLNLWIIWVFKITCLYRLNIRHCNPYHLQLWTPLSPSTSHHLSHTHTHTHTHILEHTPHRSILATQEAQTQICAGIMHGRSIQLWHHVDREVEPRPFIKHLDKASNATPDLHRIISPQSMTPHWFVDHLV